MSDLLQIAKLMSVETFLEVAESVFNIQKVKDSLIALSKSKLNRGEDSEGAKLETDKSDPFIGNGIYSITNEKNYDQDFVDLSVTGKFRRSFELLVSETYAELTADFEKEDSNIFDNFTASYSDSETFEDFILGLQDSDFEVFIKTVFIPEFIAIYSQVFKDKISRL